MDSSLLKTIGYLDRLFDKVLLTDKKRFNIKDTLFVAGCPRSGTSWIMEVLNTLPDYIYSFEPSNPFFIPEAAGVGFTSRIYRSQLQEWPEGYQYLSEVFSGRHLNSSFIYTPQPSLIERRFFARKLLVKSVRLNRILPWINHNFHLRKTFFIIRHPCAVIASQIKTGFTGYHTLQPPYLDCFPTRKQVLQEASEIDIIEHEIVRKIQKISTIEERLAVVWCLDNYIPLVYPFPHPWYSIIYEQFTQHPENELWKLLKSIGIHEMPQAALKRLKKPSTLALREKKKIISERTLQLSKWKKYLSEEQIERILHIVSIFNLEFYTKNSEPNYDHELLKQNCNI
jgi:hypothetical protein